ncbi:MAG: hypothetical protein D6696_10815 [Acidobacteria bacterium]|nr:MAG: hypothetical protein D6696_10815 [Acidobacteriota bacterium]
MLYRLAHYELTEKIGSGGMGVVYRAYDTRLERTVAIKVLPALMGIDPDRRARFFREARAAAKLNHPAIATVHEIGEARLEPIDADEDEGVSGARDSLYIAMEHVDGEDLQDRLAGGPLPLQDALSYAVQIAEALEVAHGAGVIHRDLKPRNIRLTPEGRIKILDFGLAKLLRGGDAVVPRPEGLESMRTRAGMIIGTVPYMAPEQIEGPTADPRSDLFSFGVVLYQMLSGRLPFPGTTLVEFVRALSSLEPDPIARVNPDVPPELAGIVAKLLARESGERYPSASAVLSDLRGLLSSEVSTFGTGTLPILPSPVRRRRLSSTGIAGLLVVLAAGTLAGGWLYKTVLDGRSGIPTTIRVGSFRAPPGNAAVNTWCEAAGSTIRGDLGKRFGGSVLSAAAGDGGIHADVELTGDCFPTDRGGRFDLKMTNARRGVLIWQESFEPRGGITTAIFPELSFHAVRSFQLYQDLWKLGGDHVDAEELDRAFSLLERGLLSLENATQPQDSERAIDAFEEVLSILPRLAVAHALLSEALWLRNVTAADPALAERAARASDEAFGTDPQLLAARIARARTMRHRGRFAESVEALRAVAGDHPESDVAHHELAMSLWFAGDPGAAEDHFLQAAKLRSGFWRRWDRLGSFMMRENMKHGTPPLSEARPYLRKAIALAPAAAIRPIENLGTLEILEHDFDAAIEIYNSIEDEYWTPSLSFNVGGQLWSSGRVKEAERYYERATRLQPQTPQFWAILGDVRRLLGKEVGSRAAYEEALRRVDQQLAARPDAYNLRALRFSLLAKLGSCPEALAGLSELGSTTIGERLDAEHTFLAAGAYALCGALDDALRVLRLSLEKNAQPVRVEQSVEFRDLLDDRRLRRLLKEFAAAP